MILSEREYNVLNKIATNSKMDCWFMIAQSEEGDYVYDLENQVKMSLTDGVKELVGGMIDVTVEDLTTEEILTLINLLSALM